MAEAGEHQQRRCHLVPVQRARERERERERERGRGRGRGRGGGSEGGGGGGGAERERETAEVGEHQQRLCLYLAPVHSMCM
jgi:hypothetical protein